MAEIDLNEALKEVVTGESQTVETADEVKPETAETADADANEATETEHVAEAKTDAVEDNHEEATASDAYIPDDATVERAVKAGLSIADAKAIPNAEMAERIISALEGRTVQETPDEPKRDDGDDLSAVLAELTEDNGYDANIVKLAEYTKSLQKKIGEIEAAGASAAKTSFFDSQFAGLDSAVRSHVDAARKSQLKSKFDMLEAGYKATNAKVSRESVFKEAVSLACGDLVQKASEESKTSKLAQRKTLAIARPGGESGARRSADRPMSESEIVDTLFDAISR